MKSKWVIAALLVISITLLVFLRIHYKKSGLAGPEAVEKLATVVDPSAVSEQAFDPVQGNSNTPTSKATPATVQNSLAQMTDALARFTQPNSRLKDLLDFLKKSGQEPFIVKDKNEFTGEMNIVRTKSPLPGTRYFHAQYFTGENGQEFVQHMSFQFRPGPEAEKEALATIHKTFPNLAKPMEAREDFTQWSLPNGYVVWVKKMGLKDLQDSRFNAYTKEDVGTIWVTVELNPEDGE